MTLRFSIYISLAQQEKVKHSITFENFAHQVQSTVVIIFRDKNSIHFSRHLLTLIQTVRLTFISRSSPALAIEV